jgi:hypothetical protein
MVLRIDETASLFLETGVIVIKFNQILFAAQCLLFIFRVALHDEAV